MTLSTSEARALAKHWIEQWNSRDIDGIMSHYAPNVEFEANTVVRRWHRTDGKLHGLEELRRHFETGLVLVPTLHFELENVFTIPSGYAVLYRRDNGNRVLDVVELNAEGLAQRVKAYYAEEQR